MKNDINSTNNNVTPVVNSATPSNNATPVVNPTTPSNNATPVVNFATPSNNATPAVNLATPSNNTTPATNTVKPTVTPESNVVNLGEVINNNNQNIKEEVVTPTHSKSKIENVINVGNKKNSNFLFYLVLILLVASVWFVDDIIDYFTEDNSAYYSDNVNEPDSSNLVNGYIKIGNNTSYMKINKIKFYNFKKSADNEISFDYISDKSNYSVNNDEIYIELYDSKEGLLYKKQFTLDNKLDKDVVAQYKLNLTTNVYDNAFYAMIKTYTKDEKNSKQTITCTYDVKKDDYNLTYKNVYNFTNHGLSSYDVNKSIAVTNESNESINYLSEMEKEYNILLSYNISNKYDKNSLDYTIDLNNVVDGYNTLYDKDTVESVVLSKEKNREWICE